MPSWLTRRSAGRAGRSRAGTGPYERENELQITIAYALQQSRALKKRDRMDEPQMRVAARVIEHLKRCGYVVTPGEGVPPHGTKGA